MTLSEIKDRVAEIRRLADKEVDDEGAHIEEDKLREDFILYVATQGSRKLSVMAKEVLKTDNIDFSRWCA